MLKKIDKYWLNFHKYQASINQNNWINSYFIYRISDLRFEKKVMKQLKFCAYTEIKLNCWNGIRKWPDDTNI